MSTLHHKVYGLAIFLLFVSRLNENNLFVFCKSSLSLYPGFICDYLRPKCPSLTVKQGSIVLFAYRLLCPNYRDFSVPHPMKLNRSPSLKFGIRFNSYSYLISALVLDTVMEPLPHELCPVAQGLLFSHKCLCFCHQPDFGLLPSSASWASWISGFMLNVICISCHVNAFE